ncbi:MAG: NAD(P)/FAD-dependent oxidoreductase [Myxococcales bacterium]|nr:NAD(P)/FAD-dependent oxidoreductase [Myxococcales bacterium]
MGRVGDERRLRVVVVGAGFGGLQLARALAGAPLEVLLVDRQNYHLFTPLLYQVASSLLNPSDIAFPVRAMFRDAPNVRYRQAEVTAVDLERRRLELGGGERLEYDYLVLATGSTTNYFGNASIEARALGLKNLPEALELRNHSLACLEAASHEPDAAERARLMTTVIVGGGPTGVEYAGALSELMALVLDGEYPIPRALGRIVLVEAQERLLAAFRPELGRYTEERLAAMGVEVKLGVRVTEAHDDHVLLSDGTRVESRTLVWSAGVRAADVEEPLPVPHARGGRLEVDAYLRVGGFAHAFAIGDLAGARDDGKELPMLSAPAMQQGRFVARYLRDVAAGRDPERRGPYRYQDKGIMAVIGRNAAVAELGGMTFTGFVGWAVWLLVHIYFLIGFRNRLAVLWTWWWNYVRRDRPVRIISSSPPPRLLEQERLRALVVSDTGPRSLRSATPPREP